MAGSPILATVILILLAIVAAAIVLMWQMTGLSSSKPVHHMEMSAAYFVNPISVDNARWQIACIVRNKGNVESLITNLFVNGESVEDFGIIHGSLLSSTSSMGTSIPIDGVTIASGEDFTFHLWIGGDKYVSGIFINIECQIPNQVALKRTLRLT